MIKIKDLSLNAVPITVEITKCAVYFETHSSLREDGFIQIEMSQVIKWNDEIAQLKSIIFP